MRAPSARSVIRSSTGFSALASEVSDLLASVLAAHAQREDALAAHLAAEQARAALAPGAAVAEGKAAFAAQVVRRLRVLAVRGGNHEAVLVVGEREIAVHVLDLRHAHPHPLEQRSVVLLLELPSTVEGAHRQHALEGGDDRLLLSRS